jgi:stage III sporulation protein AA
MTEDYLIKRFDGAVNLLPYSMRERLINMKPEQKANCEEIRLRLGRAISVVMPDGEVSLGGDGVSKKDLDLMLERATEASAYSNKEQLCEGFITGKGGYRIGLCGSVSRLNGEVKGFTALSSANIRISKEIRGVGNEVFNKILESGILSTLIVSPPGGGKTTLLRDLVGIISDGSDNFKGKRVSLVDERGEIASLLNGEAQMHVGARTDVMDGCKKSKGIIMMLRAMNPEVIAIDEITAPEDVDSVLLSSRCGVTIIASVHASSPKELYEKPIYKRLLDERIFYNFVFIKCIQENGRKIRKYHVKTIDDILSEANGERQNG